MNTAVITPAVATGRARRPALPARILDRAAHALARMRPARLDQPDPRTVHELRQAAERLRTENFRTVALGRLL
jgi:hypothetical protein